MIIAIYDPATKDVRVVNTDETPAIVILSLQEEENVANGHAACKQKAVMRAQFCFNAGKVQDMAHPIRRAQAEMKLREALEKVPAFHEYVDAMMNPALATQAVKPIDVK